MNNITQHLLLALTFGLLYFFSLLIQKQWVSPSLYIGAISLFYLPAGVKLLAIMLGGWAGLLGVSAVALIYTANLWSEPTWLSPAFTATWAGVPFVTYHLCLRLMRLDTSLKGLNAFQVLIMALVVSYGGSMACQALLHAAGIHPSEWVISNVLAMGFGDFTGITAMMLLLLLVKHWLKPQINTSHPDT